MIEKPKLLLLEDNELQVDLIIDSLEEAFNVEWVSNQQQLENKISKEFKVIVTDVSINNSEKTGFELIDDLRVNMRITRIPIVVYSANVNMEAIEEEQGKLFCGYVDKGGGKSGDELLEKCKMCAKEKENMVSWRVWEGYFEKIDKLNYPLSSEQIGQLELDGIYDVKIVKDIIIQLTKDDLDDESWKILDQYLWNIYNLLQKK